jgi:hypothetical protein
MGNVDFFITPIVAPGDGAVYPPGKKEEGDPTGMMDS